MPNTRFFAVASDFVLAAAEEPRSVDFVRAEVQRAIDPTLEDVVDLRDKVRVRNVRNDEAVARFCVVVLTDQDAVLGEAPAFGYEFVRVDDFPSVVALNEEGLPFALP